MICSKILEDLKNSLGDNLIGIIIVGSTAWSNSTNPRDVDIDIILKDFESLKLIRIKNIRNKKLSSALLLFVDNALDKILAVGISMFSLKLFQHNTEISLRFSTKKLFNYVCSLNLVKQKSTKSTMHYRSTKTKPFDNQKNFMGGRISYKCWYFKNDKEFLIEAPIVIIDKFASFYPGQIIDRFISFPKVVYENKKYCPNRLNKLLQNVIKRLNFERNKSTGKELHIDNCLCRSERIDIKQKLLLRLEEKCIYPY